MRYACGRKIAAFLPINATQDADAFHVKRCANLDATGLASVSESEAGPGCVLLEGWVAGIKHREPPESTFPPANGFSVDEWRTAGRASSGTRTRPSPKPTIRLSRRSSGLRDSVFSLNLVHRENAYSS